MKMKALFWHPQPPPPRSLAASLDLKLQPLSLSFCSTMWRAALLCSGAYVYMDVTNIPRVCLTPFWHVAKKVLWLKPDCACPTRRGQKNRLQLRIVCTRGKCRNMHVCLCSIRKGGLLICVCLMFNVSRFPLCWREFFTDVILLLSLLLVHSQ